MGISEIKWKLQGLQGVILELEVIGSGLKDEGLGFRV